MSTQIGNLVIEMSANVARLQADMNAAKGHVDRAMGDIKKAADFAKTALGAIGVGLSAAALGSFIKNAINAADEMGKLAQKAGVSVKALSELSYAGKLADVSNEQLGKGLQKLSKNLLDTYAGTGEAAKAFKVLGINIKDSSGHIKTSDAVLKEVAGKFASMEDGATKTALAMQIFGKGGAELIPLLNAGSAGLEAMAKEAEALGLVLDEQTAKRAEQFNDTLTTMQSALGGIAKRVAGEMLPTFNSLAGQLLNTAKDTDTLSAAADFLSGILKTLVSVGIIVKNTFEIVGKSIAGVAAAVVAAVQGNFGQAWDILKQSGQDVANDMKDIAKGVSDVWGNASKDTGAAATDLAARQRAAAKAAEDYAKAQDKAASSTKKAVDYYAKNMERELDAAEKMQEAMVKAYDKARMEERIEAEKMLADAVDATNERLNDQALANSDAITASEDMIRQIELDTQLMGLSNDERARTIALLALEKQAVNLTAEEYADYAQRLKEALDANAAKRAAGEGAEAAKAEWKKTADSIEQSLTDALMRGFESGKDFAKNLKDTLLNMFNTLILRPIIQPIASSASSAVLGALGMGASPFASASNTSNSLSGGNLVSNLWGAGAISGASAASIASGAAYGTGFLSQQSLMLLAQETAGLTSAVASVGAEIAAVLGPLGPIAAVVGISLLLAGLFKKKGTVASTVSIAPTESELIGANLSKIPAQSSASGLVWGGDYKNMDAPDELTQALRALDATLYALTNTSVSFTGMYGYNSKQGGYIAGEENVEDMEAVVSEFVDDWLAAAEAVGGLTKEMRVDFDTLTASGMELGEVLESMVGLKALEAQFAELGKTAEEKLSEQLKLVYEAFNASGSVMPNTVDGLEALIEGLDRTTAEGSTMYRALLTIAPAFVEISAAVDAVTQAAVAAAQAAKDTAAQAVEEALSAVKDAYLRERGDLLDAIAAQGQRTIDAEENVVNKRNDVITAYDREVDALNALLIPLQETVDLRLQELDTASATLDAVYQSEVAAQQGKIDAAQIDANDAATDLSETLRILDEVARREIEALQDQITELNDSKSALESLSRAAVDFVDFINGLNQSDLSALSPEQKLAEAASVFGATLAQAQAGDDDALNDLTGVAQAYLDASREYFASTTAYADIFNAVVGALESLSFAGVDTSAEAAAIDSQVAALEAEIAAIEAQVDAAKGVSTSTLSLEAAIAEYGAAVTANVAAQENLVTITANSNAEMEALRVAYETATASQLGVGVSFDAALAEFASAQTALIAATDAFAAEKTSIDAQLATLAEQFSAIGTTVEQSFTDALTAYQTAIAERDATVASATVLIDGLNVALSTLDEKFNALGLPNDSVLSFDAAVLNYQTATLALTDAIAALTEAQSTAGLTLNQRIVEDAYQRLFGRSADLEGLAYWSGQLDTGALTGLNLDQTLIGGATGEDLQNYKSIYGQEAADAMADALGIPRFASGGWHEGGWAMVGERGPELAYMPPSRIYNAGDTRNMTAANDETNAHLAATVRVLSAGFTAMNEKLERIEAATSDTSRTLKKEAVKA